MPNYLFYLHPLGRNVRASSFQIDSDQVAAINSPVRTKVRAINLIASRVMCVPGYTSGYLQILDFFGHSKTGSWWRGITIGA